MRKYYFSIVSILILVLSLLAFSDNLITDIGQESNRDPKFVIHGLILFLWMLTFVIQANFIRKDNLEAHKRIGMFGMIVAVGVVLSTLYIFVATFNGWNELTFFAKANRFFMASFAVLIFAAYRFRSVPEKHKRLILVAIFYMLEPILSRSLGLVNISLFLTIPLVWNAFFISLLIYDWATIRRLHFISYMGFLWFYVVWTACVLMEIYK
ncbi:MAG: hypothetical protein QM785_02730 [Pyrinomonadaceae bacterium]